MPDTITECVLSGQLELELLLKWLNNESIEDAPDDCILQCCTKSEFVAYFLTYLRNQTDSILQTNSNAVQILQNATPEKLISSRRKHRRSTSEPTSDERTDSLSIKNDSKSHHESPNREKHRTNESPNREKKRTGRRVKTKLFEDKSNSNISISSDESRLSIGVDKIVISTPMKNGFKPEFTASPLTPRSFANSSDRCDTPRLSRHSKSHEKCLGDFLVSATKSTKKKNKKSSSNDSEKFDLDLSNSDIFPDIGARKSSSLRSGRRIKPTNIEKTQSLSLNSFNSECFQQPPLALEDNSAFKHQKFQPKELNSFEAERTLLRQDRHKVMEKFNLLNTSTPKVSVIPQIKMTQKESTEITQTYIKADVTKVVMKDKIDSLIEIYDVLLKNNLILSINTEVYFLISILVSKQVEDDYLNVEAKLNANNLDYLLKSIHNSTYFAVKSLWNQKVILEVILDKNSLKTLGENKKVRSYSPELAKSLLNRYCVVSERAPLITPRAPAVVAYNCETDSADNFPSAQATQLFKKQRDAFYDVVRWYQDTAVSGGSRTSFRARVKTLLSHSATATNHAHLATLFVAHMLASCLPADTQESKLSKLQRRFTCPTATESRRSPHFTTNEMFYKEFICHAESESFRAHLKDALCTEIVALDGTHVPLEDGANSNNLDLTREYLQLAKKLALLAKFLGHLTALPYSHVAVESKSSVANVACSGELNYAAPKEKVLQNNIALRNYSQPSIDLKGILQNASENARLSITLPWLVHYLSMLDYTTLRLKYYNDLLKIIFEIYYNRLKLNQNVIKKNTIIYLKSILGWLFDLNHIPNDISYSVVDVGTSDGVDSCDLVDESTIIELCPCLRDVNLLLSTCRLSQEQRDMGSFRHITPVSLSVNPEDRIRNKEKELQARLEEELLKSQPSSTRRVIEMVVERVTSAAVKEITARDLVAAREHAREQARRMLAASVGESHATLLQKTTQIYSGQLQALARSAAEGHRAALVSRSRAALASLLPAAPPPVVCAAGRIAIRALASWLHHHTNTTTILCKDIEGEMRALISMNEMQVVEADRASAAPTELLDSRHTSVATPLIQLKEHICLVLEDGAPPDVTSLLEGCARSCSTANMFCRAPAQRAMLQLSVDCCVVYVSKQPQEITEPFLNKLHAIWNTCCPDRKHHSPEEITLPERREEISPQFRNFEDDERMATPISDDENVDVKVNGDVKDNQEAKTVTSTVQTVLSTSQPIQSTSQSIPSTSQPIPLTPQRKWQPIILQPINTKHQHLPKSQPVSPMLQPTNKWLHTSRSQPVSPKLQPVYSQPIYPFIQGMKPMSPVQKPISPVTKSINPLQKPTSPLTKSINTLQKPTSPLTKSINQLQKTSPANDSEVKELNGESELLECFDRILCPRNIVLLSVSKCDKSVVWEAMATVLVFLLKNDYLSEDSLTEQCLAVYRQDWPQGILESLSVCMKSVSTRWSRSSAGKFTLFLDFLAEYCGDMEYEE